MNLLKLYYIKGESDVGDFMMVTDFRCWWQYPYVEDFFRYVGDILNVLNRSPTSQTCHKHIWPSTSVTKIDVTVKNALIEFINFQKINLSCLSFSSHSFTYSDAFSCFQSSRARKISRFLSSNSSLNQL